MVRKLLVAMVGHSILCAGACLWAEDAVKEAPESVAAREQAQAYFEDDQPRKAVAILAAAATHDPQNRVLAAMLYAGLRDHLWHFPVAPPIKHGGAVNVLVFNRDGSKLASGAADGEVSISSTDSLDEAGAAAGHVSLPKAESAIVGLSFSRDGARLAVVARDSGVQIWDVAEKKVVFEVGKPAAAVAMARYSMQGGLIAFGTEGGVIQVVDVDGGKVVGQFQVGGGGVSALAISSSGRIVGAAGGDHVVHVWNLESGGEIGAGLPHPGIVRSIDFSSDERYVLTGGDDKVARLWNPEEVMLVMPAMSCGEKIVKVKVSPDGSQIATMLDDGSVQLWDALTAAKLPVVLREEAPMRDFIWAYTGMRGATASSDGHVSLWTMHNGARRGERLLHGGPVNVITFSPDLKTIAVGTEDGEARLWRTDGGMPLTTVRDHNARARSAFYSADGQHLITTSEDHTALQWISGHVDPFGPAMRHAGKVNCGVFNADASLIATGDSTGAAWLWRASNGQAEGRAFRHASAVNWVDFAPDGTRLLTASGPNATIWSLRDRAKALAVLHSPGKKKSEIRCARFSPDGKWIVTASADGTARIWDGATYQSVASIDRHDPLWCARFSPDSSLLVVTGDDARAIVYETRTWKQVGTPVLGPGPIISAVITNDNRFLAVATVLVDAVQFHEIASGRPLGDGVNLHTQPSCVDYLQQDNVVVVACDDGTVRAIEAPFVTQDVPPWVQTFAERLVGLHQTGPDTFERVVSTFGQLRGDPADPARAGNEDFPRLARWILTTGSDRNGMPRFTSTLGINIVHRVNERSLQALYECFGAVSNDPLGLAALSLYMPNARQGEFIADVVLKIPDAPPLARCYAASTLTNYGRSTEALAIVDKEVAAAPADARVLRRAGKVHARVMDVDGAIALFDKSLALNPDDYETRRAYGWVLFFFRRPTQAAVQFRKAQELQGEMIEDVIAGLCLCAAAQKNMTEALNDYGRLVALDPEWREARYFSDLRGWTQDQIEQLELVREAFVKGKKIK
ncbi:WD40 repeat protein [Chthoniobacter flavus]|nr:WD40 repeat protein [Chthoniobacter flavus]